MDASYLYPAGHHPVRRNYTSDALYDAPRRSRLDCPVRYYFIDFGISSRFREGDSPYVLGTKGRDKEAPELSSEVPYNPFYLDVFVLGHLYHDEFLMKYRDLSFLEPLIFSMLHPDPEARPTAGEACLLFQEICSKLSGSYLRWRLRPRTETTPESVIYDTVDIAKAGLYQLKRLLL